MPISKDLESVDRKVGRVRLSPSAPTNSGVRFKISYSFVAATRTDFDYLADESDTPFPILLFLIDAHCFCKPLSETTKPGRKLKNQLFSDLDGSRTLASSAVQTDTR